MAEPRATTPRTVRPTPGLVQKYFFDQTNAMHDEIVALHDFVLPTATAIWQFRKVIERAVKRNPSVTVAELSKRYNKAPETRGTTNLKITFLGHTWDSQRQRLAETALIGIIALYEIWCEEICALFAKPEMAIKMQFPTNATGTAGVRFAISELSNPPSAIMAQSIYVGLCTAKKYDLAHIDNLLKCFRYFKELRNTLMHRGRKCDGKLYGAQSELLPVATSAQLGMKFVPTHTPYQQGDPVSISMHGVLGFTDVILRMITTIDAELSKTQIGETHLVSRLKSGRTSAMHEKKLLTQCGSFGWQGIVVTPALRSFLQNNKAILVCTNDPIRVSTTKQPRRTKNDERKQFLQVLLLHSNKWLSLIAAQMSFAEGRVKLNEEPAASALSSDEKRSAPVRR
jgi:hypothetical protein